MEEYNVDIRKILYATDLSDSARKAFAWAAHMAVRHCAALTVLHVVEEDPDFDSRVVGYIGADEWEAIKARNTDDARQALIGKRRDNAALKEALHTFCQVARPGEAGGAPPAEDEVVVARGNPAEIILEEAERRKVDLIVVGSHGVGTFADALIGSVSRRVVRHATIPVMVVQLPKQ